MGFSEDEDKIQIKLVLESDGTEIDEEYFPFLEKDTTLVLLRSNEEWEFANGTVSKSIIFVCITLFWKSPC